MAAKKIRNGKFTLKYTRRDGFGLNLQGDLPDGRSERLFDMINAALMRESNVPGFKEVLDRYITDYNARVAETEAGKVPA